MTASTVWSDAPRNRYAAERKGMAFTPSDTRDAHSARRLTTVLVASIFLAVNLAALGVLMPSVIDTVSSVLTLPDLGAPQQ